MLCGTFADACFLRMMLRGIKGACPETLVIFYLQGLKPDRGSDP